MSARKIGLSFEYFDSDAEEFERVLSQHCADVPMPQVRDCFLSDVCA